MLYRVAAGGPIVNYSHLVHRRSAAFTYSWQFPNKIHRFVKPAIVRRLPLPVASILSGSKALQLETSCVLIRILEGLLVPFDC